MSPYPAIIRAAWIVGLAIFAYRYLPFYITRADKTTVESQKSSRRHS